MAEAVSPVTAGGVTFGPGHPLGQLAVGNLQTLGEGESDIREDLLAFYAKHYSANLMTLVVLG